MKKQKRTGKKSQAFVNSYRALQEERERIDRALRSAEAQLQRLRAETGDLDQERQAERMSRTLDLMRARAEQLRVQEHLVEVHRQRYLAFTRVERWLTTLALLLALAFTLYKMFMYETLRIFSR